MKAKLGLILLTTVALFFTTTASAESAGPQTLKPEIPRERLPENCQVCEAARRLRQKVEGELCSSGAAEGSYQADFRDFGQYRIFLICTGPDSMVLNMASADGFTTMTMTHSAVDGNGISFITYPLESGDQTIDSIEHSHIRVRLDIDSLRKGVMDGTFKGVNRIWPMKLSAKRTAPFPNLISQAEGGHDYTGDLTDAVMEPPNSGIAIVTDVIDGIQRADMLDLDRKSPGKTDFGRTMVIGLIANTAGNVFYVSSNLETSAGGIGGIAHVRGLWRSDDEVELYFFNDNAGFQGPFRLQRQNDPSKPNLFTNGRRR